MGEIDNFHWAGNAYPQRKCRMTKTPEETMQIIRDDVRDIRNTGFKIASLAAKCQRMIDDPIRMKAPMLMENADDWAEVMTQILECADHLNFIITEKKGRF